MKQTRDIPEPTKAVNLDDEYYLASQWKLMRRKFGRHKLAIAGGVVLGLAYIVILFAGFFAPYSPVDRTTYMYYPPTKIHFFDADRRFHLRPFVYAVNKTLNAETFRAEFVEDTSVRYPIAFFVRGEPYKFWGKIDTDIHFFGVKGDGRLFLFGTEKLGRCILSRIIHGGRISLTIGLVGVALSFIIGTILGGFSGFYGGRVDMFIQRVIELVRSIPSIPLWMGLSAIIPRDWSILKTYFAITLVLSFRGWTGLARVVRGKIISLREEDFVLAARISGMNDWNIISRHLIPSFMSYLLVSLTLAIPGMILGETSLSFLGLGIQPPAVSWGTLLKDAQRITVLAHNPWLLIPGIFVLVTVFAYNFLGDGLRDAADPYK